MRRIFWNCRGLARPEASRSIWAFIGQNNPNCLCLVETKTGSAQEILSRVGFPLSLSYPTVGFSGEMSFAWCEGLEFDLVLLNHHIISLMIYGNPSQQPWILTFIHCLVDSRHKVDFWHSVSELGDCFGSP